MNAIGITLMATTPSFAGTIEGVGATSVSDPTTIGGKNVINITGGKILDNNILHMFTQFKVDDGDIANFKLGDKTNVLNFVNEQVNINGIVNTIQTINEQNKIGGNLYFLSPNGVIIGSKGIVNTGSFYAIVPNEDYMRRLINDYAGNNQSFKDVNDDDNALDALNSLINKNFDGITLNENGQIIVNGKINAVNNIGLYAGKANGNEGNSIIIGSNAVLNTTDPFSAIVNLDNDNNTLTVGEAQFENKDGYIEICSRGDILLGKTEENQVPNEEETKITGKRVAFVADNISDVEGSKVSITAKSSKTEQNELPKDVVLQAGGKVTLNNTALKAENGSVAVLANEGITLGDVTATKAEGANILISTKKEFSYGYLSQVRNKIYQLLSSNDDNMQTYLLVYNTFEENYEKLNNYLDSNELDKAQLVLDDIIELSNNSLGADAPTPESTLAL